MVKVVAAGLVPNAYNIITVVGAPVPTLPAVFGLDVSGVIEAVGDNVLILKPGDRVYVDPHMTCGTCTSCRRGREDICRYNSLRGYVALTPEGGELLNQNPLGGLSEYVIAPDARIAKLPDTVDLRTAARLGYIGTSYAGLKKVGVGPGKTVLINGVTGTLGLAAVAIALGMGATTILGIGRNRDVMHRIEQLAPGRISTHSSEDNIDLVAWAQDATGGDGVDALFDCSATAATATAPTRCWPPSPRVAAPSWPPVASTARSPSPTGTSSPATSPSSAHSGSPPPRSTN
nr:alcohol dehydrogenase catalytic domain-containing protein [Cryobacterium sp. N19]